MLLISITSAIAQSPVPFVSDTFHIKSDGWWDYILTDTLSDELFVTHGTQVNVLNKLTGDSLGVIPNTMGVHGVALVHTLNKGFTSNGRSNSVTVFDINTFEKLDTIATGTNPDAIFMMIIQKKSSPAMAEAATFRLFIRKQTKWWQQ